MCCIAVTLSSAICTRLGRCYCLQVKITCTFAPVQSLPNSHPLNCRDGLHQKHFHQTRQLLLRVEVGHVWRLVESLLHQYDAELDMLDKTRGTIMEPRYICCWRQVMSRQPFAKRRSVTHLNMSWHGGVLIDSGCTMELMLPEGKAFQLGIIAQTQESACELDPASTFGITSRRGSGF